MQSKEIQKAITPNFDTLDVLEQALEAKLAQKMADMEVLAKNKEKLGTYEALAETIFNGVWDQTIIQIGAVAGEDFIKSNRGMTLDLSNDAHIQTTENFTNGKIATHNSQIDYQKRYDDWQNNFARDEAGNIKTTRDNRTGSEKFVLKKEARADFDKGRPTGTGTVDMDHTIPAAGIIRDPAANAHLSREEQVAFANSEKNLNPLDKAANQSKGDSDMDVWLDSERDGEKPAERFPIDEEALRQQGKVAKEDFEELKAEGQKRSVATGRQSQREEAFRIGGKALQVALMGMLATLLKTIMKKLIVWFKNGKKTLEELFAYIKEALSDFFSNIKKHLSVAADTCITSIVTAVFGPIVRTIRKAWTMLKQAFKSIREAVQYIKNPANKNKPIGVLIAEAGKILVGGASAVGSIVLGEVIEKGLMTFPLFAIEIPLFGSLASIVGLFLGALTSGIIGALLIQKLNNISLKYQKQAIEKEEIEKGNELLTCQQQLLAVEECKLASQKIALFRDMVERHQKTAEIMAKSINNVRKNTDVQVDHTDAFDQLEKGLF
ncbi:MAG: hypothetical protein IJ934_07755 [Acetobacter sp.]|nr:hypothetical protein [Acetobacter sp.]